MAEKKRILVIHTEAVLPGGGQCVLAWGLEALRADYTVDILGWAPIDFDAVNRSFGTVLKSSDFRVWSAPAWLDWIVLRDPFPYSFQRLPLLTRIARGRRHQYDLIISFCNEIDIGVPVIQYIHFPYLARHFREEQRLKKMPSLMGRLRLAVLVHRPWRLISGFSFKQMKSNTTLANSIWTGNHIRSEYQIEPIVLYPPVPGDFPVVPWEARENGFVCVGRWVPEKRYEQVIQILAQVRARGYNIHLHIAGSRTDDNYCNRLVGLVQEHSHWVSLEERLSREELAQLISRHRYGIHGRIEEHFGVAVGELVRGGCVTFVPNSGGQVEIVGGDERLLYDTDAEAVEKILQVLDNADTQFELSKKMAERAGLYSPDNFVGKLKGIVDRFLEQSRPNVNASSFRTAREN
jgi:glycosyltransferase involved in cell wall biosynthesis